MIHEHLLSRHFDVNMYKTVFVDTVNNILTVPLWNLSGQLVGYQKYNPNGDKNGNDVLNAKYFTYISKGQIGVWGLETLHLNSRIVVICEGIFDACRVHNFRLPALAVLSNNPSHLRNFLSILGKKTISICDGDKAGEMLSKYSSVNIQLSDGKDLGDLTDTEIENLFSNTHLDMLYGLAIIKNQPSIQIEGNTPHEMFLRVKKYSCKYSN